MMCLWSHGGRGEPGTACHATGSVAGGLAPLMAHETGLLARAVRAPASRAGLFLGRRL